MKTRFTSALDKQRRMKALAYINCCRLFAVPTRDPRGWWPSHGSPGHVPRDPPDMTDAEVETANALLEVRGWKLVRGAARLSVLRSGF